MSDHEELESSVAAWVLGALEPDEAASIRVHVEGCATCQQTVARLRRAAAALPLEVEASCGCSSSSWRSWAPRPRR